MRFSEVVGQSEIKQKLIKSVRDGKISHAQLFAGGEGTGALAAALAYSTYILCSNRGENDSCGTCPACIKSDQLAHPDLHFVFPIILKHKEDTSDVYVGEWKESVKQNPYLNLRDWYAALEEEKKQGVIGKNESNAIVKKLSLKSFEGGYKICIMWMPELLNLTAANKLLKIIEEPPQQTLFILVAQDYDNLLQTITSRLQLTRFKPLVQSEIVDGLQQGYNISETDAIRIASISDGDFRKAGRHVNEEGIQDQSFQHFRDWMRLCFRKDVPGIMSWVDDIAGIGRENQKALLEYGTTIFHQCVLGKYVGAAQINLVGGEREFGEKFMPFIKGSNIEDLQEEFEKARYHIGRNALPKILFLDLSFKVFRLLNQ